MCAKEDTSLKGGEIVRQWKTGGDNWKQWCTLEGIGHSAVLYFRALASITKLDIGLDMSDFTQQVQNHCPTVSGHVITTMRNQDVHHSWNTLMLPTNIPAPTGLEVRRPTMDTVRKACGQICAPWNGAITWWDLSNSLRARVSTNLQGLHEKLPRLYNQKVDDVSIYFECVVGGLAYFRPQNVLTNMICAVSAGNPTNSGAPATSQ